MKHISSELTPELIRQMNRDALTAVCAEFGIYIPAADLNNWRPTRRMEGELRGLKNSLGIILCNNGIIGYMQVGPSEVMQIHTANFTGKVETLFRMPPSGEVKEKTGKPRVSKPKDPAKTAKKEKLARVLELLEDLLDD